MIVKNKILKEVLWAFIFVLNALLLMAVIIIIGGISCIYLGKLATSILGILGLIAAIAIDRYKNNKE